MKKILSAGLVILGVLTLSALTAKAVEIPAQNLQISADNITITPAVLKAGVTATFKAKVENKGTVSATNVKVRFLVDNKQIGEKTISTVAKNYYAYSSQTYLIPVGAEGEHKLTVAIGDKTEEEGLLIGHDILEIKESANRAEKMFIVLPKAPDISILPADLLVTPPVFKSGAKINLKAIVRNLGTDPAKNFKVEFYFNGKKVYEKIITTLSAKAQTTVTYSYQLPAGIVGNQLFTAIADKDNVVAESDEKNNEAEKILTVSPISPDLSIVPADLTVNPAVFKGGDKINLKAKVRNIGTDPAKNVKATFYFNGQKIFEKSVATMTKNGYYSFTYQYQLPGNASGSQIFKAVVDEQNTVVESNESNNTAEKTLTVAKAQRDLLFAFIKPAPTNPTVGRLVSWQFKVTNAGNAVAANFRINFYANNKSDTPTQTFLITKLSPNASLVKSLKWIVPANISTAVGYTVRAVVDTENAIDETNENNNTMLYSLNLKAPDLKLESYDNTPKTGKTYPGVYLAQYVKITNDNVVPANNVKVALYYSLNNETTLTKLTEENIGTLAKKGYRTIYLNGLQPAGQPLGTVYHLIAKADNNNEIPETNEDNNSLEITRTLTEKPRQVQYPYLRVSVFDENGDPLNGAVVKLTNTSTNAVETKTTGSEIFYNSTGNVIFESRPNTANYLIECSFAGYRTVVESVAYDKDNDNTQEKYIYLDKKALVSGVVKNNTGSVLPWTIVRIEGIGLEAMTDAQGKYGFLLNGGTYTLRFSREGYSRAIVSNYAVTPLSTQILDKTLSPGTVGYVAGRVTDDEGNGLANTDVLVNDTMIGVTGSDGRFSFNVMAAYNKKFTFRKKPTYVNTEFTEDVIAGKEYNYDLVLYKPSTDNHAERGTNIVAWHQHEGTPANSFFIPEYNVDIWWGMGRVKMGLDYNKSDSQTKISKLVINVRGDNWECNKVEGDGDIETSAIDIPVTISAGSCSNKLTQMDVYKVSIESGGMEIWSDSGFWSSASDPMNSKSKVFTFDNVPVTWDSDFKVKMWVRVQKKGVIGTDGDGSGALSGYHMDKKLITWYPQKPPTTKISTSWKQIGGYFLGILSNPVNIVTGFADLYTVDQFEQYDMEDVLPQNFPGYISY
jgi:subtilase family serine protease